jgi:lipopolysaccharide transport system permease protein
MSIFLSLWRHRFLIWQMSKREVIGRYRGSVMGLMWSFFNPILMLAVYTFVFSIVFKARWSVESNSKSEFAIVLFAGLIVHGLFAECVNRAPGLILSNVNYVKKVVFPLEILPWVTLGSALFHASVSFAVLLMFYAIVHFSLNWTAIFLPVLLLPLALWTMGISWFLASVGVFVRDVGHTIGIVTTIMLFLSPVFYPVSALPENLRPLLHLNPLTFIIEQVRTVLIWGNLPNWIGFVIYFGFSMLLAWIGFFWFQKTRKGFADVL